jgi:hypothetical protein
LPTSAGDRGGLNLGDMLAPVALDVAVDRAVLVGTDAHGGRVDIPQLADAAARVRYLVEVRVAGDGHMGGPLVEQSRAALGGVGVLEPGGERVELGLLAGGGGGCRVHAPEVPAVAGDPAGPAGHAGGDVGVGLVDGVQEVVVSVRELPQRIL